MIKADAKPRRLSIRWPAEPGPHKVRFFDTLIGAVTGEMILMAEEGFLEVPLTIKSDVALAIARL
jgi:hypothetical protein